MEMETTVSISTAATRSTTVCPTTSRITPNTMLKKIRTAAMSKMESAKDVLQMLFERTGNDAARLVWIGRLDVQPVNEKRVVLDVDDQRSRSQRDGVRERETADRRLQSGLDLDDARF